MQLLFLKKTFHSVKALPLQLLAIYPYAVASGQVRIYLADFNPDDELERFIAEHCGAFLDSGMLQYGRAHIDYFHASVCKNTAHWLAKDWADVVCNLDCDRIISSDLVQALFTYFDDPEASQYRVFHGSVPSEGSTCGTVACFSNTFFEINGYDEDAFPSGGQDIDLRDRLRYLAEKRLGRKIGRGARLSLPSAWPSRTTRSKGISRKRKLSCRRRLPTATRSTRACRGIISATEIGASSPSARTQDNLYGTTRLAGSQFSGPCKPRALPLRRRLGALPQQRSVYTRAQRPLQRRPSRGHRRGCRRIRDR